jgi:hypothetical protein
MAIILLILFVVVLWLCTRSTKDMMENFTMLKSIAGLFGGSMVTYDDYGTFDFMLHTDDLPFYDPTYNDLSCAYRDFNTVDKSTNAKKCGSANCILTRNENFNKDSFLDYGGVKVRRELVPRNYTENTFYADADFERNQLHLAIKKDRPQQSAAPPQPHNIYFNQIQRLDEDGCQESDPDEYANRGIKLSDLVDSP